MWPRASVRCDAVIFPESEANRTRQRPLPNVENDPEQKLTGLGALDENKCVWRTEGIMDLGRALEQLGRDIQSLNSSHSSPERIQRFHAIEVGRDLHLEYYGDAHGEAYFQLLRAVSSEPIASTMASIRLSGPDIGANGTRNWDLTPLANAATAFPTLRHLYVEQSHPAHHNRTIIGSQYDEGGVLAEIMRKAPTMSELTVPSAPNSEFFRLSVPTLVYLNVDAGYDTQEFILNAARSSVFPNLRCLKWGEYCETYMDDWRSHCTPFDHYEALFRSDAFRSVKSFVFKNPACAPAELTQLKSIRPDLQFLVVRWTSEYVQSSR
jgi:hypothetical protein